MFFIESGDPVKFVEIVVLGDEIISLFPDVEGHFCNKS